MTMLAASTSEAKCERQPIDSFNPHELQAPLASMSCSVVITLSCFYQVASLLSFLSRTVMPVCKGKRTQVQGFSHIFREATLLAVPSAFQLSIRALQAAKIWR